MYVTGSFSSLDRIVLFCLFVGRGGEGGIVVFELFFDGFLKTMHPHDVTTGENPLFSL